MLKTNANSKLHSFHLAMFGDSFCSTLPFLNTWHFLRVTIISKYIQANLDLRNEKISFNCKDFLKVEKFQLPCLDLISSPLPSMKTQIGGGKITENMGPKSPLRKVKKILSFFVFTLKFFTKTGYLYF